MLSREDVLGWGAFQRLLARFTSTSLGRDRALTLEPSGIGTAVRAALDETREARWARTAEGVPPWQGAADMRPLLTRALPEGAVLDGPALADVARTLAAAGRLGIYGQRLETGAPGLARRIRELPRCPTLAAALAHALDPEGRLLDHASPQLERVRRRLKALRAELPARLDALLARPALAAALQERYVTVRNGRYVVPVRGDARRAIRGIVHDRSQSGATLFVEPDEVIDLNNELTQRTLEERDEELRVLGELTREVRLHAGELAALADGLGHLDLAFGRAALAERLDAVEPVVIETGDLTLRGARHPLLVAQRWETGGAIVPVDLCMPAARPGLLITGPNAGGKTVALQTVGLLTLMAQAGCHIPAEPGSRVPLCDQVLAVIGDDQNLAEDLSTFSSFVRQMRDILATATPRSLVLLDELGAGTDPAEGAALGAAFIEALLDRGARVLATSHLEPLKVFAQTEPRCQNASVAFDEERLQPTFRIEYGHPGPSYALTIGERLGLPAALIARARTHLAEERRRFEALLADLARRERESAARLADAARREREAETAMERARQALAGASEEAARIQHEAHADARRILGEARRQVGHELDRLRTQEATRREAQAAYQRLRAAEATLAVPAPVPAGDPLPTGEVLLRGLGLRGRVVADDEEAVTVRAGSLTVRVSRSAIEPAPGGSRPQPGRAAPEPARPRTPTRSDVPRELHLLGWTTDDARAAVEKFLDDALLAGHGSVRLVHGKGTGALKRAVAECLRQHPLVRAFHPAAPAEGGGGVTVAELVEGPAE